MIEYEMVGVSKVRYACPRCREMLSSPLKDAGATDDCPTCDHPFVVPGEEDKTKYMEKRRQAKIQKTSEQEQRKSVEEQRREETKARTIEQAASKTKHQLQLDRDPLKEWWLYLVIGSILILATTGRHIFAAVVSDETFLCVLILCFFLIGLVINFLSVRQLRIEYVCAAACMNMIKNKGGLKSSFSGPPAGVFH